MTQYNNPQRKNAFIWLIISVLGLLMVFVPALFDIDMMDGGGALIFIGIMLFISGILVSILFFNRSASLRRMFSGEGLLAHWRYDDFTWTKHAEREYAFRKSVNRSMFFLIGGMCLFVGMIFFIIDPEDGKYVFFVMAAVTILIGITAFLTAWLPYRRGKKKASEAFISPEGVYMSGQLHTWRGLGSRLETVKLTGENSLEFTYSYLARTGRQDYVFHVPIPEGEIGKALYIVDYFGNHM